MNTNTSTPQHFNTSTLNGTTDCGCRSQVADARHAEPSEAKAKHLGFVGQKVYQVGEGL